MENIRNENYLILLAGKRFSGKTTTGMALAEATGKRIIVVDLNEHPAYSEWDLLTVEDLKNYKGVKGYCVIGSGTVDEVCDVLNTYQRNCFIIFEDAARYIPQTINKGGLMNLVIDLRKRNFEVLFMYHALSFIPPFFAKMYNFIVIHKTNEDINSRDLQKKFNNWTTVMQGKAIKVNASKNEHAKAVIFSHE